MSRGVLLFDNRVALGVAAMLVAAFVLARPAHGQDSVRRVTLEEALRLLEQNNLEISIAKAAVDEAAGIQRQAKAYSNPSFTVTHEQLGESESDYSETYLTLSQRFEWPARRSARIEGAEHGAAAARSRLEAERARLAFAVRQAYLEAAAAEEHLETVQEVSAVFQRAEEAGRHRFAEGDLSGYDWRRLRIERASYENLFASAKLELRTARRRLASLILGPDPIETIAPVGAQPEDPPPLKELRVEEAIAFAIEHRAEYRAARADVAVEEASIRSLSTFNRPDPTVTGGYKRQSDGFDGVFVGLALPIPVLDRRRGDIEAAQARLRAAGARVDLRRRSIENEVRAAFETYESLSRRVELIRDQILRDVGDILAIARVSYTEGEMSLLELLDAAEAFHESRLSVSRLKAQHWIAYFDLERAMGGAPSVPAARKAEP